MCKSFQWLLYLRYWKRERDATRRLRRGLLAELRAYDYLDEFVADGRYEGLEDPEDKSDRIDTVVERRQRALEAVTERIE